MINLINALLLNEQMCKKKIKNFTCPTFSQLTKTWWVDDVWFYGSVVNVQYKAIIFT